MVTENWEIYQSDRFAPSHVKVLGVLHFRRTEIPNQVLGLKLRACFWRMTMIYPIALVRLNLQQLAAGIAMREAVREHNHYGAGAQREEIDRYYQCATSEPVIPWRPRNRRRLRVRVALDPNIRVRDPSALAPPIQNTRCASTARCLPAWQSRCAIVRTRGKKHLCFGDQGREREKYLLSSQDR